MARSWQCHTKQLKCIKDIGLQSSGSGHSGRVGRNWCSAADSEPGVTVSIQSRLQS